MNRRVWVCIGLIVWSELLVGRTQAQIPASPGSSSGGISITAKSAPDATPYRSQIQQFVEGQLPALTGDDPVAQKSAREKLIAECTPGSTTSYLDNYATVIDSEATQIINRNPSLRVRLNVAVLVHEVARSSRSTNLEGSVLLLINNSSESIALIGMEAAKPVISAVVGNPQAAPSDKLLNAIFPAVKSHEKSGYIAAEGYRSLIPDDTLPPGDLEQIDPLLLGPILDILNYRISLYTTKIPDNPSAETDVPTFLYRSYKHANLQLQQRIVQTLVDLISVAGQQIPAAPKDERDEIIRTLNYSGAALAANNPSLDAPLDFITHLDSNTAPAAISQKSATVYDLLKPQFSFLQSPPAVTPATAPTTKPE